MTRAILLLVVSGIGIPEPLFRDPFLPFDACTQISSLTGAGGYRLRASSFEPKLPVNAKTESHHQLVDSLRTCYLGIFDGDLRSSLVGLSSRLSDFILVAGLSWMRHAP